MVEYIIDKHTGETFRTDDHQHEAYVHLLDNERAMLFLGMSMSKTVVALTYLQDMIHWQFAMERALVIAPPNVATITWPDEANKWQHLEGLRMSYVLGNPEERLAALSTPADVYVISVSNIVWLCNLLQHKWPFDCVLIDEIDFFKGRDSGRFKTLRKYIAHSRYRIGMTGTPQPAELYDLWSQFALIDDGARLFNTWGAFADKYLHKKIVGGMHIKYVPLPGAEKVIYHKISDITLSKITKEHVKLPPLHVIDEVLHFDDYDAEVYNSLERESVLQYLGAAQQGVVTVKTASDMSNKLLQLSGGAVYDDETIIEDRRKWHIVNEVKMSKIKALRASLSNENIILVYWYQHELERLKMAFPDARVMRKGAKAREDFEDWNAGRIPVLLIHPASTSHGLNLQWGGRRMIWYTCTWRLGIYLQTIARIWRRGVDKDVFIHRLIVKGTRDEKVSARLDSRESDQDFLLSEVKRLRKKYKL